MANRFAFAAKTIDPQKVKDVASTALGTAKTFITGTAGSNSPKDVDFGPGPAPATQTPAVPDAWYKAYGKYASKR